MIEALAAMNSQPDAPTNAPNIDGQAQTPDRESSSAMFAEKPPLGLLADLQPVREALGRMSRLWGEMEQFVMTILDGWTVILHRLALDGEQAAAANVWAEKVVAELRQFDTQLKALADTVASLEGQVVRSVHLRPATDAGNDLQPPVAELPPLIVPIRPNLGEHRGEPRNDLATEDVRSHSPDLLSTAFPGHKGGTSQEMLLQRWEEVVQRLEEFLADPPSH